MILDLCAGSGMLPFALAEALPSELGDEVFGARYAVPRDGASQRVLEAHKYRCAPSWDSPLIPLDDVDVVCASGAFLGRSATGPADYGAVEPLAALLAVHRPRIIAWAIPTSVEAREIDGGALVLSRFQRIMQDARYSTAWCRAEAAAVGACHRRRWVFALGVRADAPRFNVAIGAPSGCASKARLVATPRPSDAGRAAVPVDVGPNPRKRGRFVGRSLWEQVAHQAKCDPGRFEALHADVLARHTRLVGRSFDVAGGMLDEDRWIRPEFYEWLMDWPQGWTAPAGDRADRVRICGGGVMIAQAVAAFEHLVRFVKVSR